MEIFRDKVAMRSWSRAQRAQGRTIALVPTMGGLHEGHFSLVREARVRADRAVVSIYVNPTQFGPAEDYGRYPRDESADLRALETLGCDAAYLPEDLYGRGQAGALAQETWVDVADLAQPLCGQSRPGFFRGVATVVTKLFHIVEPDVAVFGKKDYQQWRVVCRLVAQLDMPIEVIGMPTVRELDGLAMSTRNALLGDQARLGAQEIAKSLLLAQHMVAHGETEPARVIEAMVAALESKGGQVDYVSLVDPITLQDIESLDRPTLAAVAVGYEGVRLIDNALLAED